ncbi:MAG: hypothetical protein GY729_03805 [Desulfobacteraceae bacterium]|nr:hypothetical protein [Desulfobacteraceae bacterium]
MKKIIILLLFMLFMVSCISKNLTSICDTITGPSHLCRIAENHGMRLEDIGNVFIIVNAVALSKDVYSKEDAVFILEKMLEALDGPVTYVLFKEELLALTRDTPGLLDIAMVYLDEFSLSNRIYPADKTILQAWLQGRMDSLG